MCLYPTLIKNPKYKKNKKNGGEIPPMKDIRIMLVPIGCQRCKECYKKKANEWRVRLKEEIKNKENGRAYFVTFTLNTESLKELDEKVDKKYKGYERDNAIATKAIRLFLERWRKKYGRSLRHWIITELGDGTTEHLHMHGIIWTKEDFESIRDIWKYGFVYPREKQVSRNYVNSKTINYIIKYVTKLDRKHIYYKSIVLTSNGIGNKYKAPEQDKRDDKYRTEQGSKIALPIYFRNKIYTEEEREDKWIDKLNDKYRWVAGQKVRPDDLETIMSILKEAQRLSEIDGYIGAKKDFIEEEYQNQQRDLIRLKRLGELN